MSIITSLKNKLRGVSRPRLYFEKRKFERDGFVILRSVFSQAEIDVVKETIYAAKRVKVKFDIVKERHDNDPDNAGAFETIYVWGDTSGDDVFSKLVRSNKIFDRLDYFFDSPAYAYHNKIALKPPGMRGFPFHQDYAYWHNMGVLRPKTAAVFFAIDKASKENGCLKLLRGSNDYGLQEHDDLDGVETSRLEAISKELDAVYAELEPGDVVMFHGNTIHGSDTNNSQVPRVAVIGTYASKASSPYHTNNHQCPLYHPQSRFYTRVSEQDKYTYPESFGQNPTGNKGD